MSHFAKVLDTKVVAVIVAEQEFIDNYVDSSPGEWIQCSYNTSGGKHYDEINGVEDDGTPLRKNYPAIDWNYDETADAFYPPKPFDSWTLSTTTYLWEPPVAYPSSGHHEWNEETTSWDAVE
tara:strand:- start:52 stop:417 length:366 start_codon:yes stop_codon:yes gene_type:complete